MTTLTHEELPTLQAEHAHLLKAEQALLIQYNAHRSGQLPDAEPLRRSFAEFAHHLVEHFAREEASDLFQAELLRRPDLADQAEQLGRQHREMEAALRGLGAALDTAPVGQEFGDGLHRLLVDLRHHERAEDRLLLEVYWRDEGCKD